MQTTAQAESKRVTGGGRAKCLEERQKERDGHAAALAVTLSADRDSLLVAAARAVADCHAAVLPSDGAGAEHAAELYEAAVWKLNGGTFHSCRASDEAAGNVIARHCAALAGSVPSWGQDGEFALTVDGVRVRVDVGHGWGSLLDRSYGFHAVDLDGPFISETGYRSCFDTAQGGLTVAEAAAGIVAELLKSHRRYLTAEAQDRLAAQPVPTWLAELVPPPRRRPAIVEGWPEEGPVPVGFVHVDAVLPSHQAFMMRRWAIAAKPKVRAARAAAEAATKRASKAQEPEGDLLQAGQRCKVKATGWLPGSVVVVAKVCVETRTVFAYQDKPVTYKLNRKGRRVVQSDPRCIQTVYSMDALQVVE